MARQGDWSAGKALPTLRPVGQGLRVDTADVHAIAARWGASVGDLHATVAPTGLGLSCQASAAAVDAAHIDIAAFTAGLAARVGEHAAGVSRADMSYLAQEAASASVLSGLFTQVVSL